MYNIKLKLNIIVLGFVIMTHNTAFSQSSSMKPDTTNYKELKLIASSNQLGSSYVVSSISSVNGSELEKTFSTNFQNSLIARIPGLTVTQGSDEAGVVSNTLRSRGVTTFQGSNDLLVLVDGYRSSISELVPEEIETVVLLKDAISTAAYGLRGANGVLLVTTKKGIVSPLKVSFTSKFGFQSAFRLPKYLGAYDYARLYNEAQKNDGVTAGYRYSETDLGNYASDKNKYLYPNIDWGNKILRSVAPIQNYNMSFRGGDKITKYFVTLNLINNNGLLRTTEDLSADSKNQSYTRINIRSNVDMNITRRLSAEVILGMSVEDKATPGTLNASTLIDNAWKVPANSFPVSNPNNTLGGNSIFSNPWGDLTQTGYYSSNSRTINTAIKFREQLDMITSGLSASAAISLNSWYIGYSNKTKTYAYFPVLNSGTEENVVYSYGQQFGQNTTLYGDESMSDQWRNVSVKLSLDYNKSFGLSNVDASSLYDYEEYVLGAEQSYRHIGGSTRVNYSYNNKYIAEMSAGYQGTEQFKVGKQYGFFPAVALGWIISNESFFKTIKVINLFKLRISYGLTGNDNIGNSSRFMYEDAYGIIGGYPFGLDNNAIYGYGLQTLANENLTWEKEKKLNIGFNATLADAIEVSFDYFNNYRYDILCSPAKDVPVLIGAALPMKNVGKVNNQGFESTIKYMGKISKNFSYFVQLMGWFYKNKIVYNSESVQTENYMYTTGRIINQPYALIATGFYTEAEITNLNVPKPTWAVVKAGDIKYEDKNLDNKIDENDAYPVGYTDLPEFTGSFSLGFEYKGFDFSSMLQGVTGRTVYLGTDYYKAFQNNGNISEIALGRWTPETASKATYPRLTTNSSDQNNFRYSTFWQRDGSFIKLRNIELGYTFKKIFYRNSGDLRLFLNGNNLFSLDKIYNSDPEVLSGYPVVRTYSFGVKVQF